MTSEDYGTIDYEEVLRVLPETCRETWKDNPDVLIYLSDLGSLGLQRLSQEPDLLSEQRVGILEQTQDLAFHNYKTFIQAAECSHKIFQDFNIIETRLDLLLNKLPLFSNKCGLFAKDAQKISARWRQASSTLAKHPQLLEFLEMPQLMDNYIKNGYYDEALELSSYVKRLEKKNSDIPLIKSIVEDVKSSVNAKLGYLISRLRSNIQLPECLKVVGYIRRMDVFSESELRVKFLQARDSWFQKVINDIDKKDSYEHAIKVIESSRIHLFDIITQYRAIFSDDDTLLLVREDLKGNCSIFYSWITWKISWFLRILKNDISTDLGGRIDSVLAQCMYFGLSFSRVYIDFRPLLVPLFQTVSLQKFCTSIEAATFNSEKLLEMHNFSVHSVTTLALANSEESIHPPATILDFYPLASYCNDVLTSLNQLKLCSSFAMASDVTNTLSKSLSRLINTIVRFHAKQLRNMTDVEICNFNKFCYVLISDVIPHFNKCLAVLFPGESIAEAFGIASLDVRNFEHKLHIEAIVEPLYSILPPRENFELPLAHEDPVDLVEMNQSSRTDSGTELDNNRVEIGSETPNENFVADEVEDKNSDIRDSASLSQSELLDEENLSAIGDV